MIRGLIAGLLFVSPLLAGLAGCSTAADKPALVVYCAAVARGPMEQIAKDYEREHGVAIHLQFGGSNSLLSQATISGTGDLFIAADRSYCNTARDRGLIEGSLTIAVSRPVVVVGRDAVGRVDSLDDLQQRGLRVALANPDTAALGRTTEQALTRSGHWPALKQRVEQSGVFTPTAPGVASAVALGAADAGVVWRVLAEAFDRLTIIEAPELQSVAGRIEAAVLSSTQQPEAAESLLRFLAAEWGGQAAFAEHGFELAPVGEPVP